MDILVISDTHLEKEFEEKKFNLLEHLISQADRVVINGDFWEGFSISFREFIDSQWANLFPLLKKKNAIYIYGNHDKKDFSNEKECARFSDIQTNRFTIDVGKNTYIFEHGNRLLPFADESDSFIKLPRSVGTLVEFVESVLIDTFGSRHQKILRRFNRTIKSKVEHELKDHEYFVCGHTHSAEIDEERRFINTGVFKDGLAQFLCIDNKGHHAKEIFYG